MELNNHTVLYFVLRVILGLLFFFQGYDKVFKVRIKGVVETFERELGTVRFPKWLLLFSAYFTSFTELICGGLLILGLFTNWSLYLLGIDLILVVGAFSRIDPVWDMRLVFPRLMLFAVLLFLETGWNVFSLDALIGPLS